MAAAVGASVRIFPRNILRTTKEQSHDGTVNYLRIWPTSGVIIAAVRIFRVSIPLPFLRHTGLECGKREREKNGPRRLEKIKILSVSYP